jgi:hypothetical protein
VISHSHRCIFVKVPKTAGTSVALALGCEHVLRPHRNLVEIRDALRSNPELSRLTDEYFKFGFVRNPWDRVVSLYLRREGQMMSNQMSFESFVEWIEHASDTCIHPSRHKYQLDWFRDENGDIGVDFIGRFENLESDFRHVCHRLGADAALPHVRRNATKTRHYTEYYSPQTRETIAAKFAVDIEHFGYEFGD